ncbi:MAG: type 4a pilus biogenesis protein PilO [Patescibacteria group bacterium]
MTTPKYNIGIVLKKIKNNKYFALLPDLKKEKTKKYSSIIFSLISLSFFGIFAINPTLSTIAKLRKELSDTKFVDEQLVKKIANLSSLAEKYNIVEKDIPIVLEAVPKNPQVPLLMAQIQAVAKESGVEIINLQSFEVDVPGSSNNQKKYSAFSFSTGVQGNYENLTNFISTLSSMKRVISLDTLSINRKDNQPGILELDIKGMAYFKE